jgi:predicted GNAT family acetyltransferase
MLARARHIREARNARASREPDYDCGGIRPEAGAEAHRTRQMSDATPAVERCARRFQIVGEPSAFLRFHETPGRITLVHTEVPESLEGRGLGSALVRAALEYARSAGLRVDPKCPFARTYLARHAEYADLVDPEPTDRGT